MSEMDQVIRFGNFLAAIGLMAALVLAPVLFFWARKYFMEKGGAWSPIQVAERISEALEKTELRIRNDVSASISSVQASSIQQFEHLGRDVKEVRELLRAHGNKVDEAHTTATRAEHKADMVQLQMVQQEKLLDARLKSIHDLLERMEARKWRDAR